ncbi:alanine racemase [Clostridium sp. D2Q-11]|uniref:Alanine racemase n=1 Tax=Anaeromonas frigoriresistens TaxID=2683708 RepID=A0A942Z7Z5_9FIRM|nr:alanine racemase [Anaeromonas frigoriresistens]MBS4537429.1 alanine racemase [Anaeromonas frigoriresistens]
MFDLEKTRPVWAEINLENLANNIREVRRVTREESIVTAVVKANGYGHDAVEVSKVFLSNGADRLAVATLSEAIELREGGITEEPILILGYTPNSQAEDLLNYNITSTIYSLNQGKEISKLASIKNQIAKVHIKIDTGMGRLGLRSDDNPIDTIMKISELTNIEIEGIFTHFARADEKNKEFTKIQFNKFKQITDGLEKRGLNIPIKHVSNSAAIIDLPEYNLDMVRAGIMLYGLYPSKEVNKSNVNLKPAMSLKAKLSYLKKVPEKVGLSYGHIYTTDKASKIGTLPIGYADGFTRLLSGKVEGSINNKRAKIVGRICMDQCMIDLSHIDDVDVGDTITLFSNGDNNTVHIDEVAENLGTINYEIVCMVAKRVPRVFVRETNIIKIKDYNLHK